MAVAQGVVDQGEQLAGGGDGGDVGSASGRQLVAASSQPAPAGVFWTASTAAQRTRVELCLSVAVVTFKPCPPWVMYFYGTLLRGWTGQPWFASLPI